MSVLGKIYGNNVTKPEQKGYKTGAKGVLKIESVDRLTRYDILSFISSIITLIILKILLSYEYMFIYLHKVYKNE